MAALLVTAAAGPAVAQEWNDDAAMRLVRQAIARRVAQQADSGLNDYRARAHGFLFFMGQLGDGLTGPPRLIKSDQLELEVYWKAPAASKQRIVGWRDRTDLPTDIQYHRDHLGIIANDFGNRIGLGHDDEVNDVPHPLAPDGPDLYDYMLHDSLAIRLPTRAVRVYEVRTRPKDPDRPGLIGSLYLDAAHAELVRLRFNFTRAAYVDPTLEDITILLENGLWEGRYWLPRRQEIEIRRRTRWLDLPARGIIRGHWVVDGYEFNLGLADSLFYGPEIVAAPVARRDSFPWRESLDGAIRRTAGPVASVELEQVRADVRRLARDRVLSGLPRARPGAGSLSDLVRFNRVEGLAVGAGWVVRPAGAAEIRVAGMYGFSDRRLKGRVGVRYRSGALTVEALAVREVRDIGDAPVIAPLLNSLLAQEVGEDYGDYVLASAVGLAARHEVGARAAMTLSGRIERVSSLSVRAAPVTGSFRNNPALGSGTYGILGVRLERLPTGLDGGGGPSGAVDVEAGTGAGRRYLRVLGTARARFQAGASAVAVRAWGGVGSASLPPHRSFVLGGRASLTSEPFRAWGGRRAAFGAVEWRLPLEFRGLVPGPLATTDEIVVAPFLAAGWTGGALDRAVPWAASGGVRPVVGLALEWFYGLLRTEIGFSTRDSKMGVVVDVKNDLWGVL